MSVEHGSGCGMPACVSLQRGVFTKEQFMQFREQVESITFQVDRVWYRLVYNTVTRRHEVQAVTLPT